MQPLLFTKPKGFVFSLDAAIGILLLIGALFIFSQEISKAPANFEPALQAGQDAFSALSNTGYLNETIDTNSLDQSAALIRQRLLQFLPQNLDARIELKRYTLDTNSCRITQNFESCFLQSTPETSTAGPAIPEKDVFSSKKLLVLGQEAEKCQLNVELMPSKDKLEKKAAIFFEELPQIFLQAQQGPLTIDFNVTVNPNDKIACDQTVIVTLTVTVQGSNRKPIDAMLVLDRSGSMSWSGKIHPQLRAPQTIWVDETTNTVFAGAQDDGLFSFNISNPLIPLPLTSVDPGQVNDVHGKPNTVFVTETQGTDEVIAYDSTNPSSLVEIGRISFETVYGLFVSGNYVFVAGDLTGIGNDRGLYIVDATNPASMAHLGHLNLTNAVDVFVQGNTALVARLTDGVTAVDVSNPNNPALSSTVNPGGESKGIFASGNYAFVAGGSLGLAVINVSNPNNITVSDTLTPAGTPDFTNVFVKGNEALATDSASGNSNLYIADVTDPQNISFARNYPTPYTYFDIYVKGNYSFMPIDLGIVSVDIYDGPKLSNLKKSATDFVDFPGWTFPPDQMGLVSYSNFASLDAPLSSNPVPTKTGIANLVASGQTDVAPGINRAKNELTGATANPNALKFIILLGDGKENPGQGGEGQPSLNAAQQAADNNITIYTIGFGADADANLLTQIANIGKGKYYQANDKNALSEVFLIIANEITKSAQDANILVPSFGGAVIVDAGEGIIIDQNLLFDIGELAAGASWTSTYTLQFPCSDQNNCGIDAITLPGEGTQFTYTDSNGFVHTIDFNAQVTLDFLKRDLKVDIISGTVVSDDEVYLDVTVQNVAELDANAVDLNFFLNDLNGPFLTQATVPPLCSLETAGCTENSTTFNSVFISNSGKIYATIGDGTEIRECPADNTDAVFCGTGSPAQFIEMKYYLWRK